MPEDVYFEPSHVVEAARVAQQVLRPAADKDWSVKAAGLEWDCRQTLDHTVGAPLFHGTNLAMRSTKRLANPRGANTSASIGDLIDALEYTATVLEQIALAAPPNARGFHPSGMATADGFCALSTNEILLHTHDIAQALGLSFEPPAALAELVVRRLFPWAPKDAAPWAALLWAGGRGSLPGRESPGGSWMAHSAPLSEWDGVTIPRRQPA
ncbi:MAG TPA: hypothetical protein VK009_08895 [Chloroflexota bacterium]|nr:hypothetical protein [Chloroflexota bacterium]